jgi:hypothetical protein
MIAPGAVVGEIDALLAFRVGADEGAVAVDDSPVEELGGLLGLDALAGAVEGIHEIQDVTAAEAATEVARGGGVGDSLGVQGVEISLVVAEPFQMLELGAAGEDVPGDVHHMVGLMVGEMALEQMQVVIDVGDQSRPACQQEHGADAAWAQSLDPITQFVVDVAGGDHGLLTLGTGSVFDTAKDSPLASSQLVQDISFHSKLSVVWDGDDMSPSSLFPNHRGFSSFFRQMDLQGLDITLGSGLNSMFSPTSWFPPLARGSDGTKRFAACP